ncbi:Uncharacterised protein [Mycobacteroides abscessus subsp. abscessus]|nr:Uncharacterised protein [Mycobacteroides abscessus subsp. abscessus]
MAGSRKVGTSSRPSRPKPCTDPGCMATRAISSSPRPSSASRTCSEAQPPTAPAITTTSERTSWPSTTSRSRRGSVLTMPTRFTSAPASLAAAASAYELTS